jgi:squalene synthase HpnC
MATALPTIETPSGKNKDTENFPVGSFLIRHDLRAHVHRFYQFARAADDIADNPALSPDEKIVRLDAFEMALLDKNNNSVLPAAGLRVSLTETGVTPQHSLDLLRAFKQDAVKPRYKDWAELMDYCRYSASPVGRYVLALHGIGQEAWEANDALCSVLQVINHMQDCSDDFKEMNRVYLPEDDMRECGARIEELSGSALSPAMRKVLDMQIIRMKPMMAMARNLPRKVPDARLKIETAIIHELAERLINHLAATDVLAQNPKLSKLSVLIAAGAGTLKAFA